MPKKYEIREIPNLRNDISVYVSEDGMVFIEDTTFPMRRLIRVPSYMNHGKPYIRLIGQYKYITYHYVAELVLKAFRGSRNEHYEIIYKDGDITNVCLENLGWKLNSKIDLSHEIEVSGMWDIYNKILNRLSLAECKDYNEALYKKYIEHIEIIITEEDKRNFFENYFLHSKNKKD